MSVETRLENVAGTLAVYQDQMAALVQALDALQRVAEVITSGLSASRGECLELSREISANAAAPPALAALGSASVALAENTLDVAHDAPYEFGWDFADPTAEGLSLQGEADDIAATVTLEPRGMVAEAGAEVSAACQAEPVTASAIPFETAAGEAALAEVDAIETTAIEAPASETTATDVGTPAPSAEAQLIIDQIAAAANAGDGKVIELATRRARDRATTARPSRRRAIGIIAAFVVAACGTIAFQELLQTDLARQFIELGSCDGEAVAASRDCAVLAWLHL